MPDEVTARWSGWLAEAAEGLGARLRRAGLSRDERRQGRLLLQRAFDALAAGEGSGEGEGEGGEGAEVESAEVESAAEAEGAEGAAEAEGNAAEGAAEVEGAEAEGVVEGARPAPVDLSLLRAVDAAASPIVPVIPRPPRIGVPPLVTNPDPDWLAGFFAVEALADRIAGRTERILEGLRDPEVRRALGRVVTGPGGETDLTLTRG